MTRTEEYNVLLQELEVTPERLNLTVTRAKARTRRQKLRRYIGAPLISLAAACFAFVLLVNFSAPFAMACAKAPFFKELAEAVSFHPSLYTAVENEWVQPIGQSDTDNDYTMTVEYLIVDQKQLNVFYTIKGGEEVDPEDHYMPYPVFEDAQGEELTATTLGYGCSVNGELYYMTADFLTEDTMPSEVRLTCRLDMTWDESERKKREEMVAEFEFALSFDPEFTAQGKVVEVDQWMELDGQQILLKSVEVYPTHMRINLEDHPDNTAWLRGLEMYVQNEKGDRFSAVTIGISSSGSPDTPFAAAFRLESPFFADSKYLTLNITGARWLEKDLQWARVDLKSRDAGYLPDDAQLHRVEWDEDGLIMVFRIPDPGDDFRGRQILSSWRAPDGTKGYFNAFGWEGPQIHDNHIDLYYHVKDYSWDTIELELNYSKITKYAKSVVIDLA